MGEAPANQFHGYVPLGPKPYLDRFMIEYRRTGVELHNKTRRRRASFRIGDETFDVEYLVHECLLRSHGEFRCAGDEEALQFCRDTADEMVSLFGMTRDEAVMAINRQWSDAEPAGRMPRVWIVGLDIVYHETPEYWAERIFRVHASS
ncbi:hypothetical protein [Micromonospora zamorensis]|uniref:hypothetical protein n=1 Tax=Micromonospora zamorensis TaxID=709883 RepID=UPI00339EEB3D